MKTNFLFFLQAYSDQCQTSTPSLSNFQWSRQINGVPYTIENSQQIQVAPSTTSPNIIPYPFSTPLASTNGTLNGTTSVTSLVSTTSIAVGQLVIGGGIPINTYVSTITGSTLTLSNAATSSGVSALSFYSPATFIYMESDQEVSVIYNNGSPMAVNPFEINGKTVPGVFFMNGPAIALTVTNPGTVTANIFFASMG